MLGLGLPLISRPIWAHRTESDCTYVSTGKLLHLFLSVINFLPGCLKERRQGTAKAEMSQREWTCSVHLQGAERGPVGGSQR